MSGFGGEDSPPPTSVLERLRRNAVMFFGAGAVLLALRFIARAPVLSYIAGGIIVAVGAGWLMAGNRVNRKTGVLIVGVGILQALSRFPVTHITLFAGIALNVVTMWLLISGVRNLASYFITQGKYRR